MKRVCFISMLVFLSLNVMGQNEGYEKYYQHINEHLANGKCESAQRLYNAYKVESGKSNSTIEERIAQCLNARGSAKQGDDNSSVVSHGSDMTFNVGGVGFKMVRVEGGTFTMGCTSEQGNDCDSDEKPAHSVTLSNYYMGETEVTQALWKAVMGEEPTNNGGWTSEYGRGDSYPAYRVSYADVQEFIHKLNAATGWTFRLPTEAEWEYAARGGSKSRGYKYSGSNSIGDVAWYYGNSGGQTHPVKGKRANELELYDMSGNVREWCSDWYGSYGSGSQTNPQGPSTGTHRVYRGGGWDHYAEYCRVSNRDRNSPTNCYDFLGFRLVLGL